MSESNAIANGLAGAGGGIIAQIITYPLQTVNTRQQTERTLKRNKQSLPSNSTTAPGTLLQIFQVIGTEGWGGLYSGLKPSLLGTAASQGIYYYFYQVFKNKAVAIAAARMVKGRGDGTVGMFGWLVVAAIAGSLNVLFTNPIWVLVTRMQTHTQAQRKIMDEKKEALRRAASESTIADSTLQDKLSELDSIKPRPYGTIHAANEVYNEAGIVGFWKGVIPALIMVCNPSIQFMIYESSLKHLRAKRAAKKQGNTSISALEVFLVGAIAKLGATVSTYPLLVVKSRLQAKQEIGGSSSYRYSEDGTREDPQNQTIINGSLWVNLENSSCSASENNKTPEPPKEQPVFNCPICMSALEEETSTRCAHIFCKNCIRAALSAQAKCPTCRKVTRNSLIRVFLPATS